eukprot:CAMPEP_0176063368 /NCGR_PEP_ID=MMETSP0120_2-20121206/31604_1 /TAXON_ID=160619 /ORGANISM="Kryptoperidinium foliaceum, Strain CCMP 1326" /LENGTH=471 /DNA_ID=CAMNT_0017396941 /DNA_START=58 /DNA_END=1473 /DNA_ORIENTATION=-
MIYYNPGSVCAFWKLQGSVAPRAFQRAIVCSVLAYLYHLLYESVRYEISQWEPTGLIQGETTAWTMCTSMLGFLLIFRTQIAYSRYWEGLSLVEQACAVWLNGCSNLVAFRSVNPEKSKEVEEFLHKLTRLSSLLLAVSMAEISKFDQGSFPHLSTEAIDPEKIAWLRGAPSKQQVAMQWVQKHIVEGHRRKTIDIEPPIVSRVFQEFSNGIVHISEAKKLTTVPMPFAFAQMAWIMLVAFSAVGIPGGLAVTLPASRAVAYTFLIVFSMWSVHLMSVEIELPFGDDPNDLPLQRICVDFNLSLAALLEPEAQDVPNLVMDLRSIPRATVRFPDARPPVLVLQNSQFLSPPSKSRGESMTMLGQLEATSALPSRDQQRRASRRSSTRSRRRSVAGEPERAGSDGQPESANEDPNLAKERAAVERGAGECDVEVAAIAGGPDADPPTLMTRGDQECKGCVFQQCSASDISCL